jgi:hypothetical protein
MEDWRRSLRCRKPGPGRRPRATRRNVLMFWRYRHRVGRMPKSGSSHPKRAQPRVTPAHGRPAVDPRQPLRPHGMGGSVRRSGNADSVRHGLLEHAEPRPVRRPVHVRPGDGGCGPRLSDAVPGSADEGHRRGRNDASSTDAHRNSRRRLRGEPRHRRGLAAARPYRNRAQSNQARRPPRGRWHHPRVGIGLHAERREDDGGQLVDRRYRSRRHAAAAHEPPRAGDVSAPRVRCRVRRGDGPQHAGAARRRDRRTAPANVGTR